MEKQKILDILTSIKKIDDKISKLDPLMQDLSINSRNKMLDLIIQDIFKNNQFMKEMVARQKKTHTTEGKKGYNNIHNLIESLLSNIENKPINKVIFINEFLDDLSDLSDNDKNVMLQTLKDSTIEDIRTQLLTLTKIFKLKSL